MKKLLLAGMMLAFAAPAYATQPVTLPDTIIGSWCLLSYDGNNAPAFYGRINNPENQECLTETLPINKDGYREVWDICLFDKIEQEGSATYLVHARCEAQFEGGGGGTGKFWIENLEYQIIDGQLVVTTIPET